MIERIGRDSALAREAVQAAIKQATERISASQPQALDAELVGGGASVDAAPGLDFARALETGIARVDEQVQSAENLPLDLLTGKVDDFHQIAVQLKSAELSFKFAMEIRNKLVEAYREVMRMNV